MPLADYRNYRLICKHFNISYIDLRDDIGYFDYLCLLAEALDAEELEDLDRYNEVVNTALAFHRPKKIKKHKWTSIDKAGTEPIFEGQGGVGLGILNFVAAHGGLDEKGDIRVNGDVNDFESATGRQLIYPDGKGGYIDKAGNPVRRTRNTILVPAHKRVVH